MSSYKPLIILSMPISPIIADQWSDIDLLIVSPYYDKKYGREDINLLWWRTASRTDNRIEPIPVGLKRWEIDDESTIIEVARREGIQVRV